MLPAGYVGYRQEVLRPRAPSRGAVFGQVLWRTLVVSIAGGAIIGAGFIVVGAVVSSDSELAGAGFAAAVVGAIFGLFLGVPAGLVLGALGAWVLVPYKGKGFTHWSARIGALLAVGLFYTWIWSSIRLHSSDVMPLIGLTAPGVVGAFFGSLFLVRWYTKRMGD